MEPLRAFVIIVLTFLFSELRNPPANDYDIQQENMNAKYISFRKMDQQPYDKLPRGKRGQIMLASRHTTQHEEEEEAKKISVIPGYAGKPHTTQHQREEEAKKISVTPGYAGKPLYDPASEGRRSQKDIILGL